MCNGNVQWECAMCNGNVQWELAMGYLQLAISMFRIVFRTFVSENVRTFFRIVRDIFRICVGHFLICRTFLGHAQNMPGITLGPISDPPDPGC